MIRLSKFLSMAGVTSRRGAETLVNQRRVTINDIAIEKIGTIVNEEQDIVKVDGTEVTVAEVQVYVVLNKPRDVLTTLHDPFKRRTVKHLLKGLKHRVYPVGRLDYDTEGVLLLCNDGELAYRLAHPKYQIPKIYEANVLGQFTKADSLRIQNGMKLEDGAVGKAQVHILQQGQRQSRIRLTLTEGRKREVKQLCKSVGNPVLRLQRVEFAGITCKGLKAGQWRQLNEAEITKLKRLVELV